GGAGEVGRERSRVQIPRLKGQRPEALFFTIGGGATRAQGGARSAEERRAREREQPEPPHLQVVRVPEVLLGEHRRYVDEQPGTFRPDRPEDRKSVV